MRSLANAIRFLTILPLSQRERSEHIALGKSAPWFPIVGLAIGAVLVLTEWALRSVLNPPLLAVTLVVVWATLTGGLHLDGVADFADGVFLAAEKERRLEVMRDPAIGGFGAIAIVFVLLMKTGALVGEADGRGLLLAPAIGRWISLLVAIQKPAKATGMVVELQRGITRRGLVAASLACAVLVGFLGWGAVLAVLLAMLVGVVVMRMARVRLGGVTGDVAGAACEVAEVAILVAFSLGARS
ncbi:MAG: adenosylcobinamide-GDP ribazoletransferase [Anaerolineales bacterium]